MLSESLCVLKSAIAASAAWAAPAPLSECGTLLAELDDLVARTASGALAAASIRDARQRDIDRALATVVGLAGGAACRPLDTSGTVARGIGTPCDEPGHVFLSTGSSLVTSLIIDVVGSDGAGRFAFVSGTTISDIILAINTIGADIGVRAAPGVECKDRIEIRSEEEGAAEFVCVAQLAPLPPFDILFATACGGEGLRKVTDHGADGLVGDVDCNDAVDMDDLLAVLRAWGPCRDCPEDIDRDGVVDGDDLAILLRHWTMRGTPRRRR